MLAGSDTDLDTDAGSIPGHGFPSDLLSIYSKCAVNAKVLRDAGVIQTRAFATVVASFVLTVHAIQ